MKEVYNIYRYSIVILVTKKEKKWARWDLNPGPTAILEHL